MAIGFFGDLFAGVLSNKVTPQSTGSGGQKRFGEMAKDILRDLNSIQDEFVPNKAMNLGVLDHTDPIQMMEAPNLQDKDIPFFDKIPSSEKDDKKLAKELWLSVVVNQTGSFRAQILAKDHFRNLLMKHGVSNDELDTVINENDLSINKDGFKTKIGEQEHVPLGIYKSQYLPFKFAYAQATCFSDMAASNTMLLRGWGKILADNDGKSITTNYRSMYDMTASKADGIAMYDEELASRSETAKNYTYEETYRSALSGQSGRLIGAFGGTGRIGAAHQKDTKSLVKLFRGQAYQFLKAYDEDGEIPIPNRKDTTKLYTAREFAKEVMNVDHKDDISLNHLVHYFATAALSMETRTAMDSALNIGVPFIRYGGMTAGVEHLQAGMRIGYDLPAEVYFKSDGKTKRDVDNDLLPPSTNADDGQPFRKMTPKIKGRDFFYIQSMTACHANERITDKTNRTVMWSLAAKEYKFSDPMDTKVMKTISQLPIPDDAKDAFYPLPNPKIIDQNTAQERTKNGSFSFLECIEPNETVAFNKDAVLHAEDKFVKMSDRRTSAIDGMGKIAGALGSSTLNSTIATADSPVGKVLNTITGTGNDKRSKDGSAKKPTVAGKIAKVVFGWPKMLITGLVGHSVLGDNAGSLGNFLWKAGLIIGGGASAVIGGKNALTKETEDLGNYGKEQFKQFLAGPEQLSSQVNKDTTFVLPAGDTVFLNNKNVVIKDEVQVKAPAGSSIIERENIKIGGNGKPEYSYNLKGIVTPNTKVIELQGTKWADRKETFEKDPHIKLDKDQNIFWQDR